MTDWLWPRVAAVTAKALDSGALLPIATEYEIVGQDNCQFLLRTLNTLQHKKAAQARLKQAGDTRRDPFQPYDPALYVADLGSSHVCLLNKFNVVDHHLLIVTREFEPQTNLIRQQDFGALGTCMQQIDALGFYNSGAAAGASQPHKHLQLIPLPMAPFGRLPLSNALARFTPSAATCNDQLPFRHAGIALPEYLFDDAATAAQQLTDNYLTLIQYLGLEVEGQAVITPYNLLITRQWMMLVPRSREDFAGVSFNALAFCGAILVRSPEQAAQLKAAGIAHVLRSVTT